MTQTTTKLPTKGTIIIGYSQEKRPITATVVPPQKEVKKTMLIMGAIHGDEPEGPTILEHLLGHLKEKTNRSKHTQLAIIPVVNPDGLIKKTRQNANGVDLNRNFPTKDWEDTKKLLEMYEKYDIKPSYKNPEKYYYGGPSAASEPETRAMVEFLNNNKFNAVIELHSTRTHTTCPEGVVNDGLAKNFATAMAKNNNMPLSINGVNYPTPGCLGSYISDNLKIPAVTIEFRNGVTKKEALAFGWNAILVGIQYIDESP